MISSAAELRAAVQASLQARLPDVFAAIAARTGLEMPAPRTWERLTDFTAIAERQSPAVVVTTPGITPGARDGDGDYAGLAEVAIFCVVRGRDWAETADRVAWTVTAIRWALFADPGLSGAATGVTWVSEAHDELATAADRTIGAGRVTVRYTVDVTATMPDDLRLLGQRLSTVQSTHVDVLLEAQ